MDLKPLSVFCHTYYRRSESCLHENNLYLKGVLLMKKKKLEALYDQIKDRIEPVGKGYDVESARVACDAFDKLSFAEKNEVC